MKNRIFKSFALFFAFATLASTMTSCNKGYGCPNNFSVDKIAAQAVTVAAQAAVNICE